MLNIRQHNENNNLIENVVYNTYGTFFYFFCQWLITVLVVRISGYHDAGILSLIISTTNLFYCIAAFGVRNYQVSDVEHRYSDNHYLTMRILTVTFTLILFFISLRFYGFDYETILCSIVYIFYKCGEAFSDVLFGSYQRYSCYKDIAISYTLKGFSTLVLFVGVLSITQSLFLTLISNVIAYYLVLRFYDLPKLKRKFKFEFVRFDYKILLRVCFPLMLYSCMVPYLNFITRFIIENKFGIEILGYYSSVTMVLSVMTTLMNSVFVSVIPKLSSLYISKEKKHIFKIINRLLLVIILIAIIAVICAKFMGNIIFSLVFGKSILKYMFLLVPTIIASIVLTITSFLSSTLISFKDTKAMLLGNLSGVVVCTLFLSFFVNQFALEGTLYCMIFSLAISSIFLAFRIYQVLQD